MLKSNELLNYIKIDVVDSQCSADLIVNDFSFTLEPAGNEIQVWIDNEMKFVYSSFEEFLKNFIIDGKPLIEQIDLLKYNY